MIEFIFRRTLQAVFVLLVMSVLVFFAVYAVGNPVDLLINPQASEAEIAASKAALGLDLPLWEQYLRFLRNALNGNLGNSFVYGVPAIGLVLQKMPATLELAFCAMVLAICLGIPLGLYAGLKPNAVISKAVMGLSILGFSVPTFWIGLIFIMIFAVNLGWLPANGRADETVFMGIHTSIATEGGWRYLILPASTLALYKTALIIRITRAGTREASLQDYVKFARAKGISNARLIGVHILKNIMIPIVTVIGLETGSVIAFAVVSETIFAWPGMGKLLIDSINMLDRPVVVAYLLMVVFMYVMINLVVDIIYSVLDPRVRIAGAAQ